MVYCIKCLLDKHDMSTKKILVQQSLSQALGRGDREDNKVLPANQPSKTVISRFSERAHLKSKIK